MKLFAIFSAALNVAVCLASAQVATPATPAKEEPTQVAPSL
jgi:hypothetical protein